MIARLQAAISLLTCSCLISVATAATSNIGLVMTTGKVQVNGAEVPGTAAIFSGSRIATGDRSSNIQFADGSSAVIKPGATMTVYKDNSVLQQGVMMQNRVDKHPVLADGLRISGATLNAVAIVGVKDEAYMEVAAQDGNVDVRTPSGDLVARVLPGKPLSLAMRQEAQTQQQPTQQQPQQQQTQQVNLTICGDLDANYLITGSKNNVQYQLHGNDLDRYVGKTIKVKGMTAKSPTANGPEPLHVLDISERSRRCDEGAYWLTKEGLAILIFLGVGGALIGVGVAGGFGTSPAAATPTTP